MTIDGLVRAEIRNLCAYQATSSRTGAVHLHANEAPLAAGSNVGLNRYPAARPAALTRQMAGFYAVAANNVLVTRGSSEGIDLLLRTFCSAGRDNVVVMPPTFDMYRVYASIQGAQTIEVPLQANNNFSVDSAAVLDACDDNTKLIFLCTPNNPVGTTVPHEQVLGLIQARAGKSVVVVDEAYVEFSAQQSLAPLVARYDNLVVLRTLSKAHALAGARCGAVIASSKLIALLGTVLAPYAVSSPVIESAAYALSDTLLAQSQKLISTIVAERERLSRELDACSAVKQVWPSEANFLMVRFKNLRTIKKVLEVSNIVVRTYDNSPLLDNCARITVGLERENDRLLKAIRYVK